MGLAALPRLRVLAGSNGLFAINMEAYAYFELELTMCLLLAFVFSAHSHTVNYMELDLTDTLTSRSWSLQQPVMRELDYHRLYAQSAGRFPPQDC